MGYLTPVNSSVVQTTPCFLFLYVSRFTSDVLRIKEDIMGKILKTACFSLAFLCVLGIGGHLEAGTVTIPPCAFTPQDWDTSNNTQWYAYPGELYVASYTPGQFAAPLNLPNGVTLKKITIYFTDESNAALANLQVRFLRTKLADGSQDVIVGDNTYHYPAANGRRSIVLTGSRLHYKTINNNSYAYSIDVLFDSESTINVKLHEIVIAY